MQDTARNLRVAAPGRLFFKTETMEQEGLKLLLLEVENFKNIAKIKVEFAGRSVLFIGKNGAGKSALMQAIFSSLDASFTPSQPVKQGEEKGRVTLKMGGRLHGEPKEYTIEIRYSAKSSRGKIKVFNEKQEEIKNPKTIIKDVVGNISFDIFQFLNSKKSEQIKILKDLTGLTVEIDMLNEKQRSVYDTRTRLNAKIEDADASMRNHGLSNEEIDKYSEKIDMAVVREELSGVSKALENYMKVENGLKDMERDKLALEKLSQERAYKTTQALDHIKKLEMEIEENNEFLRINHSLIEEKGLKIQAGMKWMEGREKPSAEEISNRLTEASLHNEKVSNVDLFRDKQRKLIKDKQTVEDLSLQLKQFDKDKDKLISSSKLPVPGLSFNENEIFLDGLPFEEGQINTAKMIDVGMEISMAMNPGLRVIFIHEGSLCDKHTRASMIEKMESRGYMGVFEMVDDDGGELEVVYTEEVL